MWWNGNWAEIDTDLNKILLVHYAHHGVMLTKLHHLFGLLRTDLEEHFAREEKLVFPLMRTYPRPNLEIPEPGPEPDHGSHPGR